jgi:hypothetical protein
MDSNDPYDSFLPNRAFQTDAILFDDLKTVLNYSIYPEISQWTFEELFLFLNQLEDDFKKSNRNRFERNAVKFALKVFINNLEYTLNIIIDFANEQISVSAHREILQCYFSVKQLSRFTFLRTRHRMSSLPAETEKNYVQYNLMVNKREKSSRFFMSQDKSLFYKKVIFIHPFQALSIT